MPNKPKNIDCPNALCKPRSSRKRELERIGASFVAYYDSLTDEEVAEEKAWGEFAITQFPDE